MLRVRLVARHAQQPPSTSGWSRVMVMVMAIATVQDPDIDKPKKRRKQRRNPSAVPWIVGGVLLGAGALTATGIWLWRRNKRTYVGSGWDWTQRNLFPTEMSFGETLAKLGYGAAYGLPGWNILSVATMETIRQFQRDFNEIRRAFKFRSLVDELDVDGLIGENTIRAFDFALEQNRREDDSWIALVYDARTVNAGVV